MMSNFKKGVRSGLVVEGYTPNTEDLDSDHTGCHIVFSKTHLSRDLRKLDLGVSDKV